MNFFLWFFFSTDAFQWKIFFLGGVFSTLVPKEDYFSKALYTFDIGQNDLTAGFFGNTSIPQVNATIPDIVGKFIENIKVGEHSSF